MRDDLSNHVRAFWQVAVLGLVLLASFAGGDAHAQSAPAGANSAAAERLTVDTPWTTSSGATFTAPAGWSVTSGPNTRVLVAPESDSRVAIIDVEASDADAAVAAGWASYRPDAHRPLKIAEPQAPYNGWEERHIYSYETSPNEKVVVYALAWRAGKQWTVAIVEAAPVDFREAPRRNLAHAREPAAQGISARNVRRKAGAAARPRADRRADGFRPRRDASVRHPGRGAQPHRSRRSRL